MRTLFLAVAVLLFAQATWAQSFGPSGVVYVTGAPTVCADKVYVDRVAHVAYIRGAGTACTPVGVGVASSRAINTTSPITGGGDLSANRTIACPTCAVASSLTTGRIPKIGTSPALLDSLLTDSGSNVVFDKQYSVTLNNAGNSSTALTVDFNSSNVQLITLTGNVTLTFSNPLSGGRYVLLLKQDATGSRTVTWPSSVLWPGGTAPTLTTGAAKVDVITFVYDSVNSKYYGGFSTNY
jgi:hypothetical protein